MTDRIWSDLRAAAPPVPLEDPDVRAATFTAAVTTPIPPSEPAPEGLRKRLWIAAGSVLAAAMVALATAVPATGTSQPAPAPAATAVRPDAYPAGWDPTVIHLTNPDGTVYTVPSTP